MESSVPSLRPAAVLAIRLENFMGFEDTGWIRLRPLTLLFGRNSTGKSAIVRALLLLKQSIEDDDSRSPFVYSNESGVDLGSFRTLIYRHDLSLPLTISFKVEVGEGFAATNEAADRLEKVIGSQAGLSITYLYDEALSQPVLQGFSITSIDEAEQETVFLSMWRTDEEPQAQYYNRPATTDGAPYWIIHTDGFFAPDVLKRPPWQIAFPKSHDGFLVFIDKYGYGPGEDSPENEDPVLAYSIRLLEHLREGIRSFFARTSYLGPIRTEPKRFYYAPQQIPRSVGAHGEHSLQSLLNRVGGSGTNGQLEEINTWLENSSLHCRIKLRSISETHSLYEVNLVEADSDNEFEANFRDVGFGLSQLFPIMVESALADEHRFIIIEQPELHLHPKAQAELGDLFILMAAKGASFMLETHSENLLLRFRRRLAETTSGTIPAPNLRLYHEDFEVYFVHRELGTSHVGRLRFDEFGDFEKRPPEFGDFFGQDFEELVALKGARRTGSGEAGR